MTDGDELPCEREIDPYDNSWYCKTDNMECPFNDGNNTCTHHGGSLIPLEEAWEGPGPEDY